MFLHISNNGWGKVERNIKRRSWDLNHIVEIDGLEGRSNDMESDRRGNL